MKGFKQFICPLSGEQIEENGVRLTALFVVLLMGLFFLTGFIVLPLFVAIDFYIRAFTGLSSSPLSWISKRIMKIAGANEVLIDKGPKIFAARIGFLLTSVASLFAFLGLQVISVTVGSVLVVFAFLECGLNFCAGCWVYSYVVYPIVRRRN